MVAFWVVEHRVAQPIVDFALFRNGPYFGASAAAFALVGAYWSLIFFQPQYLQDALGHSATATGLLILPVTAPMIVISPLAGRLIARFGARGLMTVGMLCGLAGLVFLTQITDTSGYGACCPATCCSGSRWASSTRRCPARRWRRCPREKTGIASGVLAMDRVLAGALGLAVTGAVFQSLRRRRTSFALAPRALDLGPGRAVAVGTVLTWLFVRSAPAPTPEPAVPLAAAPAELRHHQHHRRFHL